MTEAPRGFTEQQHKILLMPLNKDRVATRKQGGKNLSYVEAWDIKAHLTRVFGFGNWDAEMLDYHHIRDIPYESKGDTPRPMIEVIFSARMQLTIRDENGNHMCTHVEGAVGSATGGREGAGIGDLYDNALKSAASDALKRCAINMGTQFGLSLYNDGSLSDPIRHTLVGPNASAAPPPVKGTEDQEKQLEHSVGSRERGEPKSAREVAGEVAIQEGAGD